MKLYGQKCYNYLLNFSLSLSLSLCCFSVFFLTIFLSSSITLFISHHWSTTLRCWFATSCHRSHHHLPQPQAADLTLFLSHTANRLPPQPCCHLTCFLFCGFSFVIVGWFWWLWWLILGGCGQILVVMVTVVGHGWIDLGFGYIGWW